MTQVPRTDYERLAHLYDVDRAHWSIDPDAIVTSLLAEHTRPIDVLDLACGTAIYLAAQEGYFAGRPVHLFGMDASRAMIDQARAKSASLHLVAGRAEALPYADGSFDYVHVSFAFHHFPDKHAALDEIAHVMRPGGRLRIRNTDPWSQPDWWLYTYFEGAWEADQVRFWRPYQLREEIGRRGFDVEIDVEHTENIRTAGDVLAEAERRVISQLANLDDDAYAAGIARLRGLPPEEPVVYDRGRLTLTATKRE